MVQGYSALKIIEIHPPFNDYCKSIEDFLETYKMFEEDILYIFPDVEIFIENRFGSTYQKGNFLISSNDDLIKLSQLIAVSNFKLRIVLDIPQLFTKHIGHYKLSERLIRGTLEPLNACKSFIEGIHIWGKKKSLKGRLVSHVGNLDTYFGDNDLKELFLSEFLKLFNDTKARYFLPEINSNDADLHSIVKDFKRAGFKFI